MRDDRRGCAPAPPVLGCWRVQGEPVMADNETVSAGTIALGIILAAVVIFGIPKLVAAYQYRQAVNEINEGIRASSAQFQQATARAQQQRLQQQQQLEARRRVEADAAALKADERCIGKQRFRRVPNGWEQIGTC